MEFDLPDGLYPFIDQRLPVADLAMIAALEQLLRTQAEASGVEMLRCSPVEVKCQPAEFPDANLLGLLATRRGSAAYAGSLEVRSRDCVNRCPRAAASGRQGHSAEDLI